MRHLHLARAAVFALVMLLAIGAASAWRPSRFLAAEKPKVDLASIFPSQFGTWRIDTSIVPIQPSPDVQKVIDETYDQTLDRTYRDAGGHQMMLSVAYGRNQHEGMNVHRPEICYPSQGLPISRLAQRGYLPFEGRQIPVMRLVASTQRRHEPITYWVIVGDRITYFGWRHKLVAFDYGLEGVIPDGILVRVSSINPSDDEAFQSQSLFIDEMLKAMGPAARHDLLGKLTT